MKSFEQVDIQSLTIGPLSQDARGNKRAGLCLKGAVLNFRLPKLRCPFGASLWQDAEGTRKNLSFSATDDDAAQFIQNIDDTIVELATIRSQELFGQKMTEETLRSLYTPLLRPSKDGYSPTIRCKVNLAGHRSVKCFAADLTPRPIPEDFRCEIQPALSLTHLWFQNRAFGAILEVTHAIIHDEEEACPFASTDNETSDFLH